jgi:hypothetical protein
MKENYCILYRVELGYNVMKGTEYLVSIQTSVVITEGCNVMVNSDGVIGTAECLTPLSEVSYKPMS